MNLLVNIEGDCNTQQIVGVPAKTLKRRDAGGIVAAYGAVVRPIRAGNIHRPIPDIRCRGIDVKALE